MGGSDEESGRREEGKKYHKKHLKRGQSRDHKDDDRPEWNTMMRNEAKTGLRKILELCEIRDRKIIEIKIVGVKPDMSPTESVEEIVSHARQPSEVLNQIKKRIILLYLNEVQGSVGVTEGQKKTELIHVCLNLWKVKNDDFLWKNRSTDDVRTELERSETDLEERRQSLNDSLQKEILQLQDRLEKENESLQEELKEIKRAKAKLRTRKVPRVSPSKPSSSTDITKPSGSRSSLLENVPESSSSVPSSTTDIQKPSPSKPLSFIEMKKSSSSSSRDLTFMDIKKTSSKPLFSMGTAMPSSPISSSSSSGIVQDFCGGRGQLSSTTPSLPRKSDNMAETLPLDLREKK